MEYSILQRSVHQRWTQHMRDIPSQVLTLHNCANTFNWKKIFSTWYFFTNVSVYTIRKKVDFISMAEVQITNSHINVQSFSPFFLPIPLLSYSVCKFYYTFEK